MTVIVHESLHAISAAVFLSMQGKSLENWNAAISLGEKWCVVDNPNLPEPQRETVSSASALGPACLAKNIIAAIDDPASVGELSGKDCELWERYPMSLQERRIFMLTVRFYVDGLGAKFTPLLKAIAQASRDPIPLDLLVSKERVAKAHRKAKAVTDQELMEMVL